MWRRWQSGVPDLRQLGSLLGVSSVTCATRNSNSRRASARLEADSAPKCRTQGLTVMLTKARRRSRMDAQDIAKTDVSGGWQGIGWPLRSVGGTSSVGSREGLGSFSMKGDEECLGSPGGWAGGCDQRVLRGGVLPPKHCEPLEGSDGRLQWAEHTFELRGLWVPGPALPLPGCVP